VQVVHHSFKLNQYSYPTMALSRQVCERPLKLLCLSCSLKV
jgi:hypothetical protein